MNNVHNKGFVKESYKSKKKPQLLKRILQSVMMGIIIGITAAFVFALANPLFMQYFHIEKDEPVTVNTESEESDAAVNGSEQTEIAGTESTEADNTTSGSMTGSDAATNVDASGNTANSGNNSNSSAESLPAAPAEDANIQGYKVLHSDFSKIAQKARKFVVQVIAEKADEGLLQSVKNERNIGLIVAENNKSFFILSRYVDEKDAVIKVLLQGTAHSASVAGYNEPTGLMVLKLNKAELSKEQYEGLEVAEMIYSNIDDLGKPVMVYGNISDGRLGYAVGSICSYEPTNRFLDANYSMLMPTVMMDSQATAVIINLDGRVMGFVDKGSATYYKEAFGISELKTMIERLSNSEPIPILGIRAEAVLNKNISKDITKGVFVLEAVENTPAMLSGIVAGDIIVKIDNIEINNMNQVQGLLRTYKQKQSVKIELMRQKLDKYEKMELELDLG